MSAGTHSPARQCAECEGACLRPATIDDAMTALAVARTPIESLIAYEAVASAAKARVNELGTSPTTVSCSQCGGTFGLGTEGFSHCADHAAAAGDRVTISLKVDGQTIVASFSLEGMSARCLTGPKSFRRDETLDHIARFATSRLDRALSARLERASTARAA